MSDTGIMLIFTCITTTAAIIAPVITAKIQAKTNLKLRQMDSIDNNLRRAANRYFDAYAQWSNNFGSKHDFVAAAFDLSTQVRSDELRSKILKLPELTVRCTSWDVNPGYALQMDVLVAEIAKALSDEVSELYTGD